LLVSIANAMIVNTLPHKYTMQSGKC
jgi:hypothetical protein